MGATLVKPDVVMMKANRMQMLGAVQMADRYKNNGAGYGAGMLGLAGEGNSIIVVGTDGADRKMVARVGCKREGDDWPDPVLVPAKLLVEVLGTLPAPSIEIGWDDRNVTIRGAGYDSLTRSDEVTLPVANGSVVAWADPLDHTVTATIVMQAGEMAGMIGAVLHAATTDEARPVLKTVHFEIEPGKVKMVATDGYRLAYAIRAVNTLAADKMSYTVDSLELRKLLTGPRFTDTMTLEFAYDDSPSNDGHATIRGTTADDVAFVLTLRCADFNYPDYNAIVPKVPGTTMVIDMAELKRHLNAAKPFADDAGCIDLAFGERLLHLHVKGVQTGDFDSDCGMVETPDTEPINLPLEIKFNVKLLVDAVAALAGAGIMQPTFHYHTATRPMMIDGKAGDLEVVTLIMPMHPAR